MNNARLILASISALCIISMGFAHADEQTAPRTISDITELLKQYQPYPKLVEENRAKARAEPPANLSGPALAQFLSDRAYAAAEIGDARGAIADQRKAVEIARTPTNLRFLSNFLNAGGNNIEMVRLNESLMSSNASPAGKVAFAASIVQFHRQTGNRDAARAALRQLESAYAIAGRSDRNDRFALRARGWVLAMDGKWDEAEAALRRSVAAATGYSENPGSPSFGDSIAALHANADNVRNNTDVDLAAFLTDRNRLDEAELVLRSVLRRILARQGPYHVRSGIAIHAFAELLAAQGRYQETTIMAQAAVASYETGGAAPEARGLANARRALASSLVLQSRWSEALTVFDEMRNGLAADPGSQALYARGDAYWGLALLKSDRAQDAVTLLAPRAEQDRKVLGDAHPQLALMRGVLGMALERSGERRRAFFEFQAAIAALLAAGGSTRTAAEVQLIRHILDGYIGLLLEIRGTPFESEAKIDAASEAFRLADLTRGQSVQGALAAVAARASAADPAIAALARKEQDLGSSMQSLHGYLLGHVSLRPEEQSPNLIADLQKRVEQMRTERRQIREELQKRFPRYADLVNPRPATLEQARAALREGEVLLSVLTTADRSYVWAVPKVGPVGFHATDLGAAAVERIVSGLRRSLDPGEVVINRLPEFDVAQAARLYETLLKPVEESWRGAKTLLVVANGALAQLPFGVLPTIAPAAAPASDLRFANYGAVSWLIKQLAVSQLPAVNTLVTLRDLPAGNAQRTAFAGFGDPQFGAQASPLAADTTTTMRNLDIRRVTEISLREGSAPTDYIAYSALPRLPDTREEILAIATALGADTSKDVFLGAQASKQNVKGANLSTRRIVAFATHGLIPGDFPNLNQPALALASPDGKTELGLLTLEDILGLKLDADWVVLSACNTAAGDGAGAEAISGLGRGFFYAGSRALLVTHWPVETRSARQLVTTLFERYAGNPSLSRAEALKQASLAVMEDSAKDAGGKALFSYAHPLFWAPYALVGDGGR